MGHAKLLQRWVRSDWALIRAVSFTLAAALRYSGPGVCSILTSSPQSRVLTNTSMFIEVQIGPVSLGSVTYQEKKSKDKDPKNLEDRLRDLLTLSSAKEDLMRIPKRDGVHYRAYLTLKQKDLLQEEWLVDNALHNGAHMPLCVWTQNSSARSEDAVQARSERRRGKKTWPATGKSTGAGTGSSSSSSCWLTTRVTEEPAVAETWTEWQAGVVRERGGRSWCWH